MEGLILAAGLGTRLAPLTDTTPKALLTVGGQTLLERVAARLVAAGATRLVVNVCHHAEQIAEHLADRDFGVPVRVSREPGGPFDTGGGLKAARHLFSRSAPILLHNVDVLTDLSLERLLAAHAESEALATLAVAPRPSARRLLFDARGLLGRQDAGAGLDVRARPAVGEVVAVPFTGVHVVAPALLDRITEEGSFSILTSYLRLAAEGARVLPFRADGAAWIDVGRPVDLERARAAFGGA
jgi:NDP-sugar pyrophosphorylase family protein